MHVETKYEDFGHSVYICVFLFESLRNCIRKWVDPVEKKWRLRNVWLLAARFHVGPSAHRKKHHPPSQVEATGQRVGKGDLVLLPYCFVRAMSWASYCGRFFLLRMCVWCVPISAIILTEVNHLPPNTQGICPTLQNVRELGILRVPRANLELAGWLANFNGELSIFPNFEKKKNCQTPVLGRFWAANANIKKWMFKSVSIFNWYRLIINNNEVIYNL